MVYNDIKKLKEKTQTFGLNFKNFIISRFYDVYIKAIVNKMLYSVLVILSQAFGRV